jgi:phosphate-selective porin OprO and OprP
MPKGQWRRWTVTLGVFFVAALLQPATVSGQDDVNQLKAELETQRQRQAELEDKINQLEARQRLKEKAMQAEMEQIKEEKSTTPAPAAPAPTDFRAYWRDGLRFTSADGMFDLRIGGRFMFDWVWMGEDDRIKADFGQQEDGVRFRRGRFYMRGNIYENMDFMLQIDFAGGEVALRDVFLGLSDFPIGKLRMGQFKEPFGLEQLTSSNQITFVERALPDVFTPGRNVGFMLHDTLLDQRMTCAAGLFRDTDDTGFAVDNSGYNLTARLTGLPWYEDKGASLLHLGAAYSYRNPDGTVRYRARPETPINDRFVDAGNIAVDQVDLLGLEAAWVAGPLSLQGEYMMANVDRQTGADVSFSGYYAQASYFLTGERRPYSTSSGTFGPAKPKNNFRWGAGPGAWELKARYSSLDLNDGPVQGGKMNNVGAGVNWYLNPNARIMWDYVHSDVEDSGKANILMMRLHVFF